MTIDRHPQSSNHEIIVKVWDFQAKIQKFFGNDQNVNLKIQLPFLTL